MKRRGLSRRITAIAMSFLMVTTNLAASPSFPVYASEATEAVTESPPAQPETKAPETQPAPPPETKAPETQPAPPPPPESKAPETQPAPPPETKAPETQPPTQAAAQAPAPQPAETQPPTQAATQAPAPQPAAQDPAPQPETKAETKPEAPAEPKSPETLPENQNPETQVEPQAEAPAPETQPDNSAPETQAETDPSVRYNVVTFTSGEGITVTVNGVDATNSTAYAEDGKIVFLVTADTVHVIDHVITDGHRETRSTGNPGEYIIEGIQTDNTIISVESHAIETEVKEEEEDKETESETEEPKPFEQSKVLSSLQSIKVTVSAPAGVFPNDAVLSVKAITNKEKKALIEQTVEQINGRAAEAAAIEAQGEEVEEADDELYSFDITIRDKDGKELQPDTSKGEVKVIFTHVDLTDVREGEATVDVYRMSDNLRSAEDLENKTTVKAAENKVEVAVDHFTTYTLGLRRNAPLQASRKSALETAIDYYGPDDDEDGIYGDSDGLDTTIEDPVKLTLTPNPSGTVMAGDTVKYGMKVELSGAATYPYDGQTYSKMYERYENITVTMQLPEGLVIQEGQTIGSVKSYALTDADTNTWTLTLTSDTRNAAQDSSFEFTFNALVENNGAVKEGTTFGPATAAVSADFKVKTSSDGDTTTWRKTVSQTGNTITTTSPDVWGLEKEQKGSIQDDGTTVTVTYLLKFGLMSGTNTPDDTSDDVVDEDPSRYTQGKGRLPFVGDVKLDETALALNSEGGDHPDRYHCKERC